MLFLVPLMSLNFSLLPDASKKGGKDGRVKYAEMGTV
jgi:hypothetical protein